MSETRRNPPWAELVQLLPVISLALPFIVQGEVDLARAGLGFGIGAALTVPVHGLVQWRGHTHNPILVGTALWLWVGAVGFGLAVEPVTAAIASTKAVGLFAAALIVGVVATAAHPAGYVGVRSTDATWVRQASVGLLLLTAAALGWALWFRADIRLGGGLPFIVVNVVRRVMTMRAP